MGERIIVTCGLAKSFGCLALRKGWLVRPASLMTEGHRFQDYTSIGTGAISQPVSEALLRNPIRTRLLSRGRQRWLEAPEGWSWVKPQARGMAILRYNKDVSSETFVDRLRRATGGLVCTGTWFGIEGHI